MSKRNRKSENKMSFDPGFYLTFINLYSYLKKSQQVNLQNHL